MKYGARYVGPGLTRTAADATGAANSAVAGPVSLGHTLPSSYDSNRCATRPTRADDNAQVTAASWLRVIERRLFERLPLAKCTG